MSLGTYSPTIQSAYKKDPSWFENYVDSENRLYDKDGYDQYGYDRNGTDRAGNTILDYQESAFNEDETDLFSDVLMTYVGYDPRNGG